MGSSFVAPSPLGSTISTNDSALRLDELNYSTPIGTNCDDYDEPFTNEFENYLDSL